MTFTSEVRNRFYGLSQSYPGFEDVLTQALFALVAQEHMLWYSRPGRAKSTVARAIFGMFSNAPTFSIQMTKDMMPDALFGSPIPNELMQTGKEIYNLDGGIVTSVFSYLDEFSDAPDYVLRAMLNVLNERIFESKDMGSIASPLHSAIMTTNYLRQREATEAVLDRILCKAVVPGITDLSDCVRAGQTYLKYPDRVKTFKKLDYRELLELSTYAQAPGATGITLSPGMRLLHVLLVQEFQQRRLQAAKLRWAVSNPDAADEPDEADLGVADISPRRLVKLHDLSRASAALNDRSSVISADNRALGYGLFTVGDNSGDTELWHNLCDEYLSMSSRQLTSLERLGEIADDIGQIKAERGRVTTAQFRVGGTMIQGSALTIQTIGDLVHRSRHPALSSAKDKLTSELQAMSIKPAYAGFNLLNGWR